MESQLKNMRVAELRDIATRAGLNIPVKITKDKIIAILITKPEISSFLTPSSDAAQTTSAPNDTLQPESAAPSSEPAAPAPALDDLLVPPPDLDWAAQPAGTATQNLGSVQPAHVAKPATTEVLAPAASNAYGTTANSAAAASGAAEPAAPGQDLPQSSNALPDAETTDVTQPLDPHPLDGPSKAIGELEEVKSMTLEERIEARKKRFQSETSVIPDTVAQGKAGPEKDSAVSKSASGQAPLRTASKANGSQVSSTVQATAEKTNGTYNLKFDADILEKRAKKFGTTVTSGNGTTAAPAGATDVGTASPAAATGTASPVAQPAQKVPLDDEEARRRLKRQQMFGQLLPGQPGYDDSGITSKTPSKRQADEASEDEPDTKRSKVGGTE